LNPPALPTRIDGGRWFGSTVAKILHRTLQHHLDKIPARAKEIETELGIGTGPAYGKALREVNDRPEVRELCKSL